MLLRYLIKRLQNAKAAGIQYFFAPGPRGFRQYSLTVLASEEAAGQ